MPSARTAPGIAGRRRERSGIADSGRGLGIEAAKKHGKSGGEPACRAGRAGSSSTCASRVWFVGARAGGEGVVVSGALEDRFPFLGEGVEALEIVAAVVNLPSQSLDAFVHMRRAGLVIG